MIAIRLLHPDVLALVAAQFWQSRGLNERADDRSDDDDNEDFAKDFGDRQRRTRRPREPADLLESS